MHETPVQAGQIIADKYRIERVLGVGGMGVVVAATHIKLGGLFAIKCLTQDKASKPEAVARFLREAQAVVRIRSTHVARVYDFGTLPDGHPYIVMEHLEGSDLAETLHQRRRLPISEVSEYLLQACEAIAEAHAMGIIHRDIKPSNLFLTQHAGSPLVKVLDFGISKAPGDLALSDNDAGLTDSHSLFGSPRYMSPEQFRSTKHVDARSDVWSLGVTLYELVTGVQPFTGDHFVAVLDAISNGEPERMSKAMPNVPRGLEQVVLRCLHKDPAKRFQNVADFGAALAPFAPRRAHALVERIANLTSSAAAIARPAVPPINPQLNIAADATTQHLATTTSSDTEVNGRDTGPMHILVGEGGLSLRRFRPALRLVALGFLLSLGTVFAVRGISSNESPAVIRSEGLAGPTASPATMGGVPSPVVSPVEPLSSSTNNAAAAPTTSASSAQPSRPPVAPNALPPSRKTPPPTRPNEQLDERKW